MQNRRGTLDCLDEWRLRCITSSAKMNDIPFVLCAVTTRLCASSRRFRGIPLRCIESFRLSVGRSCDFLSRHAGRCPCAGTCGAPMQPSIGYLLRPASSDSSMVTWRSRYGGRLALMRVPGYVHPIAERRCMSKLGRNWSARFTQANRIWTWTNFLESFLFPDIALLVSQRMSSLM